MSPLYQARRRRELFAGLVRAHGVVLATVARRLVGAGEVEDVVQAALMAAWRHFEAPDAIQNPRGWLMRFVVHECGNLLGRRQRQPARVGLDDGAGHGASGGDIVSILQKELEHSTSPDPRLLLEYVDEGLSRSLRTLNEVERTTLTLRCVADLSYKEISDAMGVPIGTVMSRLCRAREKVRVDLGRRNETSSSTGRPTHPSQGTPSAGSLEEDPR